MTTVTTDHNTLGEAVRYLAGRCDWAHTLDGVGFNQADTGFGHWLADVDEVEWTAEQARAAYELLGKYRRQLETADIDFDAIPVPAEVADARRRAQAQRAEANMRAREAERAERERALRRIDVDPAGRNFVITFPFDWSLVEAVKAIPGRRWDGARNTVPTAPENAGAVRAFAVEHDFTATDAAQAFLDRAATYKPVAPKRVELAGKGFAIHFPKDFKLIEQVRAIEGRRWDGDNTRWLVPQDDLAFDGLSKFLEANEGFEVAEDAAMRLSELAAEKAARDAAKAELADASRALEASIEIETPPGLALRPFQLAGVDYALRTRRTFIADAMGVGKTIEALMAIEEAGAYPAVVVMRSSIKRKWRAEVRKWLPHRSVTVLNGTKPHPADVEGFDVIILNYDILAAWAGKAAKDFVQRGARMKDVHRPGLLAGIGAKALVIDESHYVKTPDSLRTRAALMIALGIPEDGLILNLTGTPVPNRPIELAAQLAVIRRLEQFGGYWKYARRYAGAYRTEHGMDVSGATNTTELHERLRSTAYIRRTKEQVLPELPAIQVAQLPVGIDNAEEYREAEHNVLAWVREQVEADVDFMDSIADLPEDERKARIAARKAEKVYKARQAEELVKLNALRRLAAEGKLSDVIDWIEDFLESSEEKLVVFAHHRDIQEDLREHFGSLRIHADDDDVKRFEQMTRFQEDPNERLIVASLEAAREGIDLYAASNVLFVEFGWNAMVHDQAESRVHRIGQEAESITAWYAVAEGTIDEDMNELVEAKRAVSSSVTDGVEAERSVSMAREVMDRLKARALEAMPT